jgi:hypothetical protein
MYNWQCFLHMAWGTAGVCLLARRLGGSAKAVIVAGLAWGLSGYTTAQWTSGLLLFAGAWVPWAAVGHLALFDSLRAGGKAWYRGLVKAALPGVFAVLLGEVFLATIGAGFGMAFAAVIHQVERRANPSLPRARPTWYARACLATLLAFGAGAVILVPAGMLMGASERAAPLSRDTAESCSLHPLRLLEFAAPHSMGDAYGIYPAAAIVGEAKLDGLPLSYSMYMGASVIALALAAFGRGRKLALALGAILLAALLLAFGKHTPVHGVFRRVVWPLAYMRYPEKYMVVVVTAVALLAGIGAQRLLSAGSQPWRRNAIFFAGMLACGVTAYLTLPPIWLVFAVRGVLLGSLALLGILAVHHLASRGSSLPPLLLVAIVSFDLATAAWPLQGFGPRQIASTPPPAVGLALRLRASPLAPPRVYRSNQTTDTVNRWVRSNSKTGGQLPLVQTLIGNTVTAWGLATLPGYDAAIPLLEQRLWNKGLDVGQSVLRLLGAEYAVLPVADPKAPRHDRPGLEPIADPLPGARLYRVPGSLPRVFLARHAEVLPDDKALERMFEPEIVAGESVWLAPEGAPQPLSAPPGRAGECHLEAFANHRLVAVCTARERGFAVFVEQYDRGWRATLDGRPARLLRANLIMRALPVEPGSHRIVLAYHTPGLAAGSTVSVLCLLVLGGLWWQGGSRRGAKDARGMARAGG